MVIWLIGMSASGKTTIGKKLYSQLLLSDEKWIFLDGDTFRNVLGEDLGHTVEDRRKNAYRISRFCEFLSSQGVNVLACVLSIFHDNQRYNRENIENYKEVFIDVELENLLKRDNKELYKKALNGEIKDVVGVDIEFTPPYAPDMTIDNNQESPDYTVMVNEIISNFEIKLNNNYSYTENNLLENPHKYQYSKFEGVEFFTKHENDRTSGIKFFEKRLKKLNEKQLNTSTNLSYGSVKEDENLILKEFLIYLYQSDESVLMEEKTTIELLIKRFEVGKKLYFTYDLKEIRKSSIEFDELLNYPLFSLVLQKYYRYTQSQQKLVYLNAILKVNDIISSVKSDFIVYGELFFAKKAFEGELKIVEEYL